MRCEYSFVTYAEINTDSIFNKYAHIFLSLSCYGNIIVPSSFRVSGSFVSLRVALWFLNTRRKINLEWVMGRIDKHRDHAQQNIRNLWKSLEGLWSWWRHDMNTVSSEFSLVS